MSVILSPKILDPDENMTLLVSNIVLTAYADKVPVKLMSPVTV